MQALRRGQLGALAALAVAVTLAHLWLADNVLPTALGDGAEEPLARRIEVAFVRQLEQRAPAGTPPVATAPRRQAARAVKPAASAASAAQAAAAAAAASAASAAMAAASDPDPVPQPEPPPPLAETPAPPTPDAVPPLAQAATPAGPASAPVPVSVSAADAAASSAETAIAQTLEWPPSTRLSYRLSGNYRGPVEGTARVEWLRDGSRYQVVMDLAIGPPFAPLMTRRVGSEGEITAQGLHPRRYDEVTQVLFGAGRRRSLVLDAESVRLSNGREVPRPAGLQDSASQFVQLTWLFTTQPQLLQAGRSIELPLALPGGIQPWTYDVLAAEALQTPAGPVATLRVKPRREPRPGGDLTAEFWVAPSLQYLPVRILIRQDAETFVDLLIDRLPEQAERGK